MLHFSSPRSLLSFFNLFCSELEELGFITSQDIENLQEIRNDSKEKKTKKDSKSIKEIVQNSTNSSIPTERSSGLKKPKPFELKNEKEKPLHLNDILPSQFASTRSFV